MIKRIINAVAPIRICDIGGWTDTWFARQGAIFNIAVDPYVEVQIQINEITQADERVVINLENYGDTYAVDPRRITYDKHPLIEAAIETMDIPDNLAFRINIFSAAPPGASTGTSAAVSVALIGALDRLTDGKLTPYETAMLAHSLETERLGLQCGIQDQLCSAYGGINFIQMHTFPHASVSPVHIANALWWELEQRLAVVYMGTPHSSSDVHKKVIADLGSDASGDARIIALRKLALDAKNALFAAEFSRFGAVMDENTAVQRSLHADLVSGKAEEIISIAREFGALGIKVNGAGGDGGSLTILTNGDAYVKRRMLAVLQGRGCHPLPIYLSRYGVRVWHATGTFPGEA